MENRKRKWISAAIILLFFAVRIFAQDANDPVFMVGNGVTSPQLVHKADPEYSPEAKAAHIHGPVLYSLVVGKGGTPRDIEVVSPLGYGLDEKGIEAIRQWIFVPGKKNGQPVSVRVQVTINFVLI